MHFKPETSFHGNVYVMYITNFAYKNFLDLNLFFIISSMKILKSMQSKIFQFTESYRRNSQAYKLWSQELVPSHGR